MLKELKDKQKILKENKEKLKQKYYIKSFGIFGSFLKGTQKKNSDIDILIEFKKSPSMFVFIQLEKDLSVLLKRKVDLVTKKALKRGMKKDVLKNIKYV